MPAHWLWNPGAPFSQWHQASSRSADGLWPNSSSHLNQIGDGTTPREQLDFFFKLDFTPFQSPKRIAICPLSQDIQNINIYVFFVFSEAIQAKRYAVNTSHLLMCQICYSRKKIKLCRN